MIWGKAFLSFKAMTRPLATLSALGVFLLERSQSIELAENDEDTRTPNTSSPSTTCSKVLQDTRPFDEFYNFGVTLLIPERWESL